MITIQELLYNRGLDKNAQTKLVRHKDKRFDLYYIYKSSPDLFLDYQCSQENDVFRDCEYIVSFIGEENNLARFIGVYKVLDRKPYNGTLNIEGREFRYKFLYLMCEVEDFEDLKDRVIIRWENAISWHQWIKNEMEVVEISPGLHYKHFTDYFDIIISFGELQEIIINQYKDWKIALSSVKGVYLITDTFSGKLYVGSAYGDDGIWGRWKSYVHTNGHGGNKMLKSLIDEDWEYAVKYFRFSILTILPTTTTTYEVIKKEQLFKRKLGSNSFGLNNN